MPSPAVTAAPGGPWAIEVSIRRFLMRNHPGATTAIARMRRDQVVWDVVDSLTLLDLVSYLEQEFEIEVRPVDFVPRNFATIARMSRFVTARRSEP
jgi:hypothetical protein